MAVLLCISVLPSLPSRAATLTAFSLLDSQSPNTEKNPYLIQTENDLMILAAIVNTGETLAGNYFRQTANLALNGAAFTSIGGSSAFCGSYDGNSCSITGLNQTAAFCSGLFGLVGEGGVVKNVNISGSVSCEGSLNGMAGLLAASVIGARILSCTASGSASASASSTSYAGGLIGYAQDSSILACSASADVTASGGAMLNSAGGICGYAEGGSITSCTNACTVSSSGGTESAAGGVSGVILGCRLNGCVNSVSGRVTASNPTAGEGFVYAGGIAGSADASSAMEECANNGTVLAQSPAQRASLFAGGICGSAAGMPIASSSSGGNVTAQNGGMVYVGGIAGASSGAVSNCRGNAVVTAMGGSYAAAGGIVGEGRTIVSCMASGTISIPSLVGVTATGISVGYIGGIAGIAADCDLNGCTSSGTVAGAGASASAIICGGGLAGMLSGKCVNGAVTGGSLTLSGKGDVAGGIAGMMSGGAGLYNSYSRNTVSAAMAGQLVGSASGQIQNCYTTARVSGQTTQGLCGQSQNAAVRSCYWISDGSTAMFAYYSNGCGSFTDAAGDIYNASGKKTGSTLLKMLNQWVKSAGDSVGADYWTIQNGQNAGYPVYGDAPGFAVSVSSSSGGSVTADKTRAEAGDTVTLTIKPDKGCKLLSLRVNNETLTAEGTTVRFVMPAEAVTVSAVFAGESGESGVYSVVVETVRNGSIAADRTTAKEGDWVTVRVRASNGYRLRPFSVRANGQPIAPCAEGYRFRMPADNVVITGDFTVDLGGYRITAPNNLEGGVVIPECSFAAQGERVVFAVVPDEGFAVRPGSVTVNGEALPDTEDNLYSFEMDAVNVTLRAQFIPAADLVYPITIGEITGEGSVFCEVSEEKAGKFVILTVEAPEEWRLQKDGLCCNDIPIEETGAGIYRFTMPEQEAVITAVFEKYVLYTITISSAIQNGKLALNRERAGLGDRVMVEVKPVPGYRLVENSLKYNSIVINKVKDGLYSFLMPEQNVTITAEFVKSFSVITEPVVTGEPIAQTHTISLSGIRNGTVMVNINTAKAGTAIVVTPKPDSGYQLKNGTLRWNNQLIPYIQGGVYGFTMPDANVVITAEFEKIADISLYTVKVKGSPANGSLTLSRDSAPAGSIITVRVEPESGYQLKSGSLKYNGSAVESSAGVYRFVMPAEDVSVTGEFELSKHLSYMIDCDETPGGTVTASRETAEAGERVTLTVTPDAGYKLENGALFCNRSCIITSGSSCTFIMPESDVTISAVFIHTTINDPVVPEDAPPYTITLFAHTGGTVERTASNSIGNVAIAVTPEDGYAVSDVLVDGESVGAVNLYTFDQAEGEHIVEAYFIDLESKTTPFSKLKTMLLSILIIAVASVLIITALVLLISSLIRMSRNSRRRRSDLEDEEFEKKYGTDYIGGIEEDGDLPEDGEDPGEGEEDEAGEDAEDIAEEENSEDGAAEDGAEEKGEH